MNPGHLRLLHLREQHEAVGETMAHERQRFDRIAGAEPTRAVSAFNLFQTPEAIAERMAAMLAARIDNAGRWLEPSAGLGRLYRAGRGAGLSGDVAMVDESPACCAELYAIAPGAKLIQGDFLTCDAGRLGGLFDGVLMNPPFKMGRDIKHIIHALTLVNPGGRVVTLCATGPRQQAQLRPQAAEWLELPAGTFDGTRVVAAIAVFTA